MTGRQKQFWNRYAMALKRMQRRNRLKMLQRKKYAGSWYPEGAW